MAYFAVMMKGRGYNRRFFRGREECVPQPNVYVIQESNDINRNHLKYFGTELREIEKNNSVNQINELLDTFYDARELGSIINVDTYDWKLLNRFVKNIDILGQINFETIGIDETQKRLSALINLGNVLSKKYEVVTTNPPYMGSSSMSNVLSTYTKKHYPEGKLDLFAVFIQRCLKFAKFNGMTSMITQHSWMFLSSYEKLRREISYNTYINLLHLGTRAFDEIGGEVVQTVAFVVRKSVMKNYMASFRRLVDYSGEKEKREAFFEEKNKYYMNQEKFEMLPGEIIAYWISDSLFEDFREGTPLGEIAYPRQGMATTNNNRFLRFWYELDNNKIEYNAKTEEDTEKDKKWFPYNKGGEFRKWYGNNDYVVNFYNHGKEICDYIDSHSAVDHKGTIIPLHTIRIVYHRCLKKLVLITSLKNIWHSMVIFGRIRFVLRSSSHWE